MALWLLFLLPWMVPHVLSCTLVKTSTNQSSQFSSPHRSTCETTRKVIRAKSGNSIDDCWRTNKDWNMDRMRLADCAIGYGADASGGKGGKFYTVVDPRDDPIKPWPGTLRYGIVQPGPLWIIFKNDMAIKLKAELIVSSYKTIDARGANILIGLGGPCITIQNVTHVIIHGLHLHNCGVSKGGMVMSSPTHTGKRLQTDGDAISIFASNHIWIDHNSLMHSKDGLVDVVHLSTYITISNNYFSEHDEVMLFGATDTFSDDKNMKVTVVYNHFGQGCVQRMPRVRYGHVHVANNNYERWLMYAIGGSCAPTIYSEGNRFVALQNKEVTKLETGNGGDGLWISSNDLFVNGAYFVQHGKGDARPHYTPKQNFIVKPAKWVPIMTADAGPL